jgi:hypothetical protein
MAFCCSLRRLYRVKSPECESACGFTLTHVLHLLSNSRDSSVGIALGYKLDDRGSIPGGELGIFLCTTASRTTLGPTQPPIQWVPGALSLGIKRPGCEADHSPPSSAEVKECVELYFHSPDTPSWCGAQLKKEHRDNFYFLLLSALILSHASVPK